MAFVNYFGYGANKSPEMIEGIVGRVPEGRPAELPGFELVIQKGDEIPKTVRKILAESWSPDELDAFRTYAIRQQEGAVVEGTLWKLTPQERELVNNWEINDGLWYQATMVDVQTEDGQVKAGTEMIDDPSLTPAVELEPDLPVFLNSRARMLEVAGLVRTEYLSEHTV